MPPRGRKRKSGQSVASEAQDASTTPTTTTTTTTTTTGQQVAANLDSPAESPRKRRRIGITAAQKQALLDNLQLEVTERARKLRAQYHLQAQGLRTRIEIRINRIPMALRKVKMGDLLQKYAAEQKPLPPPKQTVGGAAGTDRHAVPPPVPEKDVSPSRSAVSRGPPSSPQATRAHAAVGRPMKRLSDALAGGDKENQNALLENPKKRQRGHPTAATGAQRSTQQVLSPASSNSRLNPRDRDRDRDRAAARPSSPAKSLLARPLSPTKPLSPAKQAAATNLLSSMVEKARATRAAAATRKATTSSSGSSAAAATGTRTRARGTGATTAAAAAAGAATNRSTTAAAAAAARTARRASGTSASSDASASTVVRRVGRPAAASTARKATGTKATATAAAAAAPAAKRTVMSSLKKGVTNATASRKAPAARSAAGATATAATTTTTASTTTRSGRVLRKRD
ncbi:Borealin-lik [Niveomyces insectorum RCEF 264]|uniref:Borealin-lik n=1 Tax=Niveomyces insectorum RCEF 264 TaxID=1081102 RepID=A0A162MBF8_9HYPO|nr:Borealin-lik [Niveomyces insectorum RCEF 264]